MSQWNFHVMVNLLKDRPHAIGAEIGVFRGVFAQFLLRNLPQIEKYYCIDPWVQDDDYLKLLVPSSLHWKVPPPRAFKQFKTRIEPFQEKVVVLRKMSQDALIDIPDGSLDWVFVDANHAYEYARNDIIGWSAKVKVGGIISGHDYHDNKLGRRTIPFGVKKAVRELISDYRVQANVWYTVKKA